MTKAEVTRLLAVVKNAYPNFQPDDMAITIDIWHELLIDYTYGQIMASLKSYMIGNTSQFAPSVGQLVNGIYDIQHAKDMTAEEAWGLVYKAIANSAYNSAEQFDKLPRVAQRAVGSSDNLKELALKEDFDYQVEKAVFIRGFRVAVEREKQIAMIPQEAKAMIEQAAQGVIAEKGKEDYGSERI